MCHRRLCASINLLLLFCIPQAYYDDFSLASPHMASISLICSYLLDLGFADSAQADWGLTFMHAAAAACFRIFRQRQQCV